MTKHVGFFSGVIIALLMVGGIVYMWSNRSQPGQGRVVQVQNQPGGDRGTRGGDRGTRGGDRGGFQGGGPGGFMMDRGGRGGAGTTGELTDFIDMLAMCNLDVGFDLNKDQKTQIKQLRDEFKAASEKWRTDNEKNFQALNDEMRKLGRDAAREDWQAVGQKRQELMKTAPQAEQVIAKIKALLTPDQAKALEAYQKAREEEREAARKAMEERMNQMRQQRGGGQGGGGGQ